MITVISPVAKSALMPVIGKNDLSPHYALEMGWNLHRARGIKSGSQVLPGDSISISQHRSSVRQIAVSEPRITILHNENVTNKRANRDAGHWNQENRNANFGKYPIQFS